MKKTRHARKTNVDRRQGGQVVQFPDDRFTQPRVRANTTPLKPLTDSQRGYDTAIDSCRVIFGVGAAGTGKTWWAAARAAEALLDNKIKKIIITRPIVEAGEKLGYLPGGVDEKVEPYLAAVREALEERMGAGHVEYLLRKKVIEVRPLAYMRGSTFKNAWVIADEMQNATHVQMKLFLSRIGNGAKFIINGDTSQIDIANGTSGLEDAVRRLRGINGIEVVRFAAADNLRDPICRAIVEAYEED
jgi:phosphate starvation-inducible PhoH-like protein